MSPPTVLSKNKFDYDWVLLNSKWWTVQNYSPEKLADDTDIPIVTDQSEWVGLTTPARCVYNNSTDTEFIDKHGFIYNRHAVNAGLKMPCAGCRVPTEQEWIELKNWQIAKGFNWDGTTEGNKIGKALASDGGEWDASGTEGHVGNDQASNNSSGFNALPGGYRWGEVLSGSDFSQLGRRVRYHCVGNIIPNISYDRTDFLFTDGPELNNDNGYYVKITATAPVVTFNSNGGSAVEDEVTFIGELATEPTAPSRAGYNFNGWYSDEALTTEWDFDTDTVDEDTTLYAGWVGTECKIEVINSSVTLDGKPYNVGEHFLNKRDWSINFKDDIISNKENILIYFDQSGVLETPINHTNSNYIKSVNYVFNNQTDFFFTDISVYGESLLKLKHLSANKILGREGTNGEVEEISLGSNLEFDGKTLNVDIPTEQDEYTLVKQLTEPSIPDTDRAKIYLDSNEKLILIKDDGTKYEISMTLIT